MNQELMMHIPLTEPIAPRYIHINPTTNMVHLMVPVVGGQEISTDNTCKATVAMREFFLGGALRELNAYKKALVFDIGLMPEGAEQRVKKEARLAQIETYIDAVSAKRMSFANSMSGFLAKPSNLYSIQLRPRAQDSLSSVLNPVFNVNRRNDQTGKPLSELYNAMHSIFPNTVLPPDPRTQLITAVLNAIPTSASFSEIQQALSKQSLALFGLNIDFTLRTDGTLVNKEVIDTLMDFDEEVTRDDYIDVLLSACAPDVWKTLDMPPFYNIPATEPEDERAERLSILTQFFLANLNIYCKAHGLSSQNFGIILDASPELSHDLASTISTTLTSGADVENAICLFCNKHASILRLSRAINSEDLSAIRQTFERRYRTITTGENPHMDDFMILDKEATAENAKFVTHQGSICVNFAEIIDPVACRNPDFFESIRADFAIHPVEIDHRNEFVAGDVELNFERITDEQFERLPAAAKEACRANQNFQARHFLDDVAKGRQEAAEVLLTITPTNTQNLLQTTGVFTDYSGRTFNCTAYEYAYWAKDTHMCRMLEGHMDEETKAFMAARIDDIERIDDASGQAIGLVYTQAGQERRSAHFDFTPLKEAYQHFLDDYNNWRAIENWAAMEVAWLNVGKAQRNVPAHVAQEYCRTDRSFETIPEFNEGTLPRILTFFNFDSASNDSWYPLATSHSGLGFNFVMTRWGHPIAQMDTIPTYQVARADLAAITRLDEVRTIDLRLSREHLNPLETSHGMRR